MTPQPSKVKWYATCNQFPIIWHTRWEVATVELDLSLSWDLCETYCNICTDNRIAKIVCVRLSVIIIQQVFYYCMHSFVTIA